VYRSEAGLVLKGVVQRSDYSPSVVRIHIDAVVTQSDGRREILASSTPVSLGQKHIGCGPQWQPFAIPLPAMPAKGIITEIHRGEKCQF